MERHSENALQIDVRKALKNLLRRDEFSHSMDSIMGGFKGLTERINQWIAHFEAREKELRERIEAIEGYGIKFQGVYQRAQPYARGHVVVSKGSSWIALKDIPAGIEPAAPDWALMARAGRNGKDATP